MRLLLDTCTFLWLVDDVASLSPKAAELLEDIDNELYLSAASAWEIAIKYGSGKLELYDLPEHVVPEERRRHGIRALPIDEASTLTVRGLPAHHRDPFDRLLVAQAIVHELVVVTPDPKIERYPASVVW